MENQKLTLDVLLQYLREAGGSEGLTGTDDVLDIAFTDLGYDSLALLETAGRIERECGVRLEDSTVTDAPTPRALLEEVNKQLFAA